MEERDVVVPAEVIRKIQEDFELDKYELASFFGISLRSAIDWLKHGIRGERGLNVAMIDCLLSLQILAQKDPESFMTFQQLRGLTQKIVREPSLVFFQFTPYEDSLDPIALLSLKHPRITSLFMSAIFALYLRNKGKPFKFKDTSKAFEDQNVYKFFIDQLPEYN